MNRASTATRSAKDVSTPGTSSTTSAPTSSSQLDATTSVPGCVRISWTSSSAKASCDGAAVIPLEEARAHVLATVRRLPAVRVPVDEAAGLVLAEPVAAGEPVPPFDNTAMDGFALRAADTAGAPVTLDVVATLAAGSDPAGVRVGLGQAVRIMTGAALPDGADAIVMVESTSPLDGGDRVRIETVAAAGDHIRRAGDDLQKGDAVVAPGTVVTPAHVGVLASVGVT